MTAFCLSYVKTFLIELLPSYGSDGIGGQDYLIDYEGQITLMTNGPNVSYLRTDSNSTVHIELTTFW